MDACTLFCSNAHSPRWSRATRELFFIEGDDLMTLSYAASHQAFELERRESLFQVPRLATSEVPFDVAPDGRRFLFSLPLSGHAMGDQIHVSLDGFEELRSSNGAEE
jgi:hypothetical protein